MINPKECPNCKKDWSMPLDCDGTRGCGSCGALFKDGKVIKE